VNGTTTVFVTDNDNREVLEYDGASGAIQRWYAYGLGSNDVLNQMNVAAGTRATVVPDIQGSVIASLDSSSGTLSKIGYLPYGKSASAMAPFGYTGQRIDPETNGLYYYRARMYAPAWGRFMQVDPLGTLTDVPQASVTGTGNRTNLYAYVRNDPLNNTDPSGLYTFQFGVAGGGTILGVIVPQGGIGIVIDTQGNIGSYAYTGVGLGFGVEAHATVSLQTSNAPTIYDLQGQFNNGSVTAGAGFAGSVDYFSGNVPATNAPILGAGTTIGFGAGASASITVTSTQICGTQGCFGSYIPFVK
jgi:RHS repeat-associated protein